MGRIARARWFGIAILACAFALGVTVLVQSVRGQEDEPPPQAIPYPTVDPDATPTFTADQISELSERRHAEAQAKIGQMVDAIVASDQDVSGFRHAESNSLVLAPDSFAEALARADALLIGTVRRQTLFRASEKRVYLVSALTTDSGETKSVGQEVNFELTEDGSLVFVSIPTVVFLESGVRYALLASTTTEFPFELPSRGHVFSVGDLGELLIQGEPVKGDLPSSLAELIALAEAKLAR